MGFDKDDPRPLVHPARKTTKVNISMIVGVLVFIVVGVVAVAWFRTHHGF